MAERYTIGTLARQVGVNVETIRYYQRRGLVQEPAKPFGGIRHYAQAHARRLRFIKEAQRLGFSLDEVGELLSLMANSIAAVKTALNRQLTSYQLTALRRRALAITDTDEKLMARAATRGLSSQPVRGYSIPAASGIPRAL